MKLLVLVHHDFEVWETPTWFDQRLREDFPQLEVVRLDSENDTIEDWIDADAALTWSLRPKQLERAKRLQWIHCPAAAVNQLLFPEFIASDVILTNGRDVHGAVVAEHVVALIFALAKKLPWAMRLQAKHVWGQDEAWHAGQRPREVKGAVLGLVGVGAIGREVAKYASVLGMTVLATRANPDKDAPEGVERVFGPDELAKMLALSDYVVLAAPVTGSTNKLLDASKLAVMKPSACVINVGRGVLVDEAALEKALRGRKIAAAALDVFEKEPLPKDSPLWDLENLLITPHIAGVTGKVWERQYEFFSENLRRFMHGKSLRAVVNKQDGY
jgi:phosphoglycerate dehydrogenase-like enzyme